MATVAAAFVGTVAFALLFGVPKRFYPACGFIGAAGWLLYLLLEGAGLSAAEATVFAALAVALLSRFAAVWQKCPSTVFLIAGIFPLVPGAGIYWTSYYLVTGALTDARATGFAAVKTAVAIVLGIILVFELPGKVFHPKIRQV